MPLSLCYWIVMLIWLLCGVYVTIQTPIAGRVGVVGGNLLLFILFLLIGLRLFGAPLHGG